MRYFCVTAPGGGRGVLLVAFTRANAIPCGRMTELRRTAALAVAVLTALLLVVPNVSSHLQSCTSTSVSASEPTTPPGSSTPSSTSTTADPSPSTTGEQPAVSSVTTTCGPPDATVMLPLALVIGLLMLPDLSELAIPGLVSLKRRVEVQADRQVALERDFTQMRTDLRASQTTRVTNNFVLADLVKTRARLEDKTDAWDHEGPLPIVESDLPVVPLAPDVAINESELLHAAARIDRYLDVTATDSATGLDQASIIDRWRHLFAQEIQVVQAARNAVAHPPHDLTDADLRHATDIAQRLLALLEGRFEHGG